MPIEFISARSGGRKIYGVLHLPRETSPPCVIASHGLFSTKDSEKFIAIGNYFSRQGIAVIRYDHQGCGESEGDIVDTTVTSRIADLDAIVELALQHPLLSERLGLLGSSMGGFVSIFKRAANTRVKALALWATPSCLVDGRDEIERGGQEEGIPALREDFYRDAVQYDGREAIKDVDRCLILHGDADEIVPVFQATELYELACAPKRIEIFAGGDHRFTNELDRQKAIEMSCEWFLEHL